MRKAERDSPCKRRGADRSFPKSARLISSKAFRDVFAESITNSDPFFVVRARPNLAETARLGIAVSKKCARRSVDRSRIKRIIRESFRWVRNDLPVMDYVVIARHAAVKRTNPRLFESLRSHWTKFSEPDA
ncbi:ribonuclease P protein component [Thioflavicoccus mobilis 8321]|uniref:Ribonuclease P protein component n=1 Tax=Thioflavicoccus mobilis 8321 TaxID=765912 RepID=L0GU26_9GAMM|nr:ribonuclease P protein component [Thioflavicoccus mobilis 8321]